MERVIILLIAMKSAMHYAFNAQENFANQLATSSRVSATDVRGTLLYCTYYMGIVVGLYVHVCTFQFKL